MEDFEALELNPMMQAITLDEKKARDTAIAARLLAGEKRQDLAVEYHISLPTISRIARKYITVDMMQKMEAATLDVMSDMMITNVEMGLDAMACIARQATDPSWLFVQKASELGTMYGIISDKMSRTIESHELVAKAKQLQNGQTDEEN